MSNRRRSDGGAAQLLPELAVRAAPRTVLGGAPLASADPVAEIAVDTPLAHLDRPFEYAVPQSMAQSALPGVRVKVRFAGADRDGFVLARKTEPDHLGRLVPLRRVVSPEPVLTAHLARVCRQLADHYGGTLSDVLRLAIPPRHARAEAAAGELSVPTPSADDATTEGSSGGWRHYPAGRALLRRLAEGQGPRAAVTVPADQGAEQGWPALLATAASACLQSGRSAVILLPDHRDVERVVRVMERVCRSDQVVRLSADLGPQHRYTAWLRALRGQARVVVGTRSAAFAPVADLGLLAWWDDGDDLHREPRAPYPHVREVARLRALDSDAGLLAMGYTRSVELQHWVEQGLLRSVQPTAAVVRAAAPRVLVAGEGPEAERDPGAASARIPSLAWRVIKDGLTRGPVLVQVPRRGYVTGLSCQECRTPVRCARCGGPCEVPSTGAAPVCSWCQESIPVAPCAVCGGTTRRGAVRGERRTAEELGRAFPGVSVRSSGGEQVIDRVERSAGLVVSTPGAEPVADNGYAAAVLLDGWALLDRAGADAAVEACRRWMIAAGLTRAHSAGGVVVLCGVPAHGGLRSVEALAGWSPVLLAERELADRRVLGLPPVGRMAALRGAPGSITTLAEQVELPPGIAWLGGGAQTQHHPGTRAAVPGAATVQESAVLLAEPAATASLPELVHRLRARRSLHKIPGDLQIVLDPP